MHQHPFYTHLNRCLTELLFFCSSLCLTYAVQQHLTYTAQQRFSLVPCFWKNVQDTSSLPLTQSQALAALLWTPMKRACFILKLLTSASPLRPVGQGCAHRCKFLGDFPSLFLWPSLWLFSSPWEIIFVWESQSKPSGNLPPNHSVSSLTGKKEGSDQPWHFESAGIIAGRPWKGNCVWQCGTTCDPVCHPTFTKAGW